MIGATREPTRSDTGDGLVAREGTGVRAGTDERRHLRCTPDACRGITCTNGNSAAPAFAEERYMQV